MYNHLLKHTATTRTPAAPSNAAPPPAFAFHPDQLRLAARRLGVALERLTPRAPDAELQAQAQALEALAETGATEGLFDNLKKVGKALKNALSGKQAFFDERAFAELMKIAHEYDKMMQAGGGWMGTAFKNTRAFDYEKAEKKISAELLQWTPKGAHAMLQSVAALPALLERCYRLPFAKSDAEVEHYFNSLTQTLKPFLDAWEITIPASGVPKRESHGTFETVGDLPANVLFSSLKAVGWTPDALAKAGRELTSLRITPVITAFKEAVMAHDRAIDELDSGAERGAARRCLSRLFILVSALLRNPAVAVPDEFFMNLSFVEFAGSDRFED